MTASGNVVGVQSSQWFGGRKGVEIMPGDTIVVPLQADKMRPMVIWTGVTNILYQVVIAVAAVKSF